MPSRWYIVVAAVVVVVLALAANAVGIRLESPSAGLSASTGAALPGPAQSTVPGYEHTRSFDVVTHIAANGDARVQETIVQDFDVVARHGIERVIPLRDGRGEHRVSHLVVSTSDGTPNQVSVNAQPDTLDVRIGDPDRTITGAHTYRLEYDIGGMIDSAGGGRSRFAADAISAWQQTIDALRYTVIAPARPTTISCQQGRLDSRNPCGSARRTATGATFTGTGIAFKGAFTVRLTWPDTVVAVNTTESTIGSGDMIYAVLAGLAVALIGWRYRRRWEHLFAAAQTQLWATFGPDVAGAQPESYDLTGDPAIEFVPPMGLRPGEIGSLAEADMTKLLTATVVDLAARGAMKITESGGSWTLKRRNRTLALTADEQTVMSGIFGDAEVATLDDRGTEMGALAGELAEHLTDDLEQRGLAVPGTHAGGLHASTRQWWLLVVGVAAVVAGAIVHVILVTATGSRGSALAVEAAIVLAAILGVGAIFVHRAARGLTPLGLAAIWRVRGFERFFTQSEAMHARAAADRNLLRQYMGYAIVFGYVTQWLAAFDNPDTSDWFASSTPMNFAFVGFTASSLWSAPAPSTSGFGGGGGGAGGGSGGGGGGSW